MIWYHIVETPTGLLRIWVYGWHFGLDLLSKCLKFAHKNLTFISLTYFLGLSVLNLSTYFVISWLISDRKHLAELRPTALYWVRPVSAELKVAYSVFLIPSQRKDSICDKGRHPSAVITGHYRKSPKEFWWLIVTASNTYPAFFFLIRCG